VLEGLSSTRLLVAAGAATVELAVVDGLTVVALARPRAHR
jgi:hypothetical protein